MYTKEQTLQIIQLWYETKSPAVVRRRFNTLQDYKSKSDCTVLTDLKIQRITHYFQNEKILHKVNKGRSGRQTAITLEKREQVRKSVNKNLEKSYRIRAKELFMPPTTLLRVMRKDLKLFPFRISTRHVLQQQDKEKRIEMCNWLNEKLEQLPAGSITFGLVMKHTFISMGRLITTPTCLGKKVVWKKLVRSTSKVRRSLRLWPSMQSTVCWELTSSKKMGAPLSSTVSVISLFLTNFMVT